MMSVKRFVWVSSCGLLAFLLLFGRLDADSEREVTETASPGASWASTRTSGESPGSTGQEDLLRARGPLSRIAFEAEPAGRVRVVDGRLAFEFFPIEEDTRSSWPSRYPFHSQIQPLFDRHGGGSSGGGGRDSWRSSFSNEALSAEFSGDSAQEPSQVTVKLDEQRGPGREVLLQVDGDDIELMLTHGVQPYFLRFHQQANGRVRLQEVNRDQVTVIDAATYSELSRSHPVIVEERLNGIWRMAAVEPPLSPLSESVRKEFFRQLNNPPERIWPEEFLELAAALAAPQMADRTAAKQELEARFHEWEDTIWVAAFDPDQPLQTRITLIEILETIPAAETVAARRFIMDQNLLADAAYLRVLQQQPLLETERELLKERLAEIVDSETATETAATSASIIETGTPLPPWSEAPTFDWDDRGELTHHIGRLVQLGWSEDGMLGLDRQHWKSFFSDQTFAELTANLRNEMQERGFPASWVPVARDPRQVHSGMRGYPEMLFRCLLDAVQQVTTVRGRSQSIGSQGFTSELLNGQITVTYPRSSGGEPIPGRLAVRPDRDEEPLPDDLDLVADVQLMLGYGGESGLEVAITDRADGLFSIRLRDDDSRWFVQIYRDADGIWSIADLRGSEAFAASANTLLQLYQQHPSYFEDQLFGTLRALGIGVVSPNVAPNGSPSVEQDGQTGTRDLSDESKRPDPFDLIQLFDSRFS